MCPRCAVDPTGARGLPGGTLGDVIDAVVAVLAVGATALTAWGLVAARRDRPPGRAMLGAGVALEALLLVQALVAAGLMVSGTMPAGSTLLFVSYLLTVVLVLPLAVAWALSERDRWSSVVVAVAAFTVAAMVLRLWDVWRGGVAIGGPGG